jgi:hypothetical protein
MLNAGCLDYAALASRCRTNNEFRRLHIDLENTLAPAELSVIKTFVDTQGPDAQGRAWLGALQKLSPSLLEKPQAYQRHVIAARATLYREPGSDIGKKGLLVAFTGVARRLMLPVCVVLQLIDSRRWDVVVLRKYGSKSFLSGLEDVPGDFAGLIRHLQRALRASRYRRRITLGTSGGGSAAIMAALLMGADRGLSICGSESKTRAGNWLRWRLRIGRVAASAFGRELWYVYGSDFAQDVQSAHLLRTLYGGELHPIPGADVHNVFSWLLERGRLAAYLEDLIE